MRRNDARRLSHSHFHPHQVWCELWRNFLYAFDFFHPVHLFRETNLTGRTYAGVQIRFSSKSGIAHLVGRDTTNIKSGKYIYIIDFVHMITSKQGTWSEIEIEYTKWHVYSISFRPTLSFLNSDLSSRVSVLWRTLSNVRWILSPFWLFRELIASLRKSTPTTERM